MYLCIFKHANYATCPWILCAWSPAAHVGASHILVVSQFKFTIQLAYAKFLFLSFGMHYCILSRENAFHKYLSWGFSQTVWLRGIHRQIPTPAPPCRGDYLLIWKFPHTYVWNYQSIQLSDFPAYFPWLLDISWPEVKSYLTGLSVFWRDFNQVSICRSTYSWQWW